MNKAQKYLLDNELDDLRLKDAQKVENWIYVSDIMELYHQEQVKKLTIPVVSVALPTPATDIYINANQMELTDFVKWYKTNVGYER